MIKKITLAGLGLAVAGAAMANPAAESAAAAQYAGSSDSNAIFATDFSQMATVPSFSMGAPAGLVPSWGVVYGGAGMLTSAPAGGGTDAAGSVGVGFGDAINAIGGGVSLGIGSLDPRDGGAFNRGDLSVSFGHLFTQTLTGVAVGVNNIGVWTKNSGTSYSPSYYAAVTQLLPNDIAPVVLNAGVGNNSYAFEHATKQGNDAIGVFASAAAYVLPQLALVADYTSGATSLGVSVVPVAKWPLTVNLGAYDVFKYVPDHQKVSFTGSIAYAYAF